MCKKKSVLILGAGSRGSAYSAILKKEHRDKVSVIAVAEPRIEYRQTLLKEWELPPEKGFCDWRVAAQKTKMADAVFICTQDKDHVEPAIAFAEKGYHILLEKPMAPTAVECRRIVEVVQKAGVLFAVCHVLRYTPQTVALKQLIDEGCMGRIICMQRLEPVGFWHQAHSYVRGDWRNVSLASNMLLAKSCHDLDWMRYIMDSSIERVHSFGSLQHFRKEDAPKGAAERCLECAIERECPYSAIRIYVDAIKSGERGWPVRTLSAEPDETSVRQALAEGDYGCCVYHCDNDVVDNQVVNLEFTDGCTASFTMTAFTEMRGRDTRLFGTRGEVVLHKNRIEYYRFIDREWREIPLAQSGDASAGGGHEGGDSGLIAAFVKALIENNPAPILSGPSESLETHLAVFAAEKARLEKRVVSVSET